jgi:hypothetical protein
MKIITFQEHFVFLLLFSKLLVCSNLNAQTPLFEKSFGQVGVDIAFAVKQNPDSSIYMFGYSQNASTQAEDFALSKLSPNGDLQWTKYYGTPDVDFGLHFNLADSFDLILVGFTAVPGALQQEILVIKVDSAGQERWRRSYGGPGNQNCRYVEKTSDGMYILCGSASDPWGTNDVYVLKLDANGNMVWDSTYAGLDNDYGMKIIESTPLNYVLSADTRSVGNGGYDVAIFGLNDSAAFNFSNVHGDAFQNGCQGIMKTSLGVYVIYGETEIATFSPFDFFFYMFDELGGFLRENVFGGIGTDALFDVVETPNGDLIGCGYSNSSSGGNLPLNLTVVRTDSVGNVQFVKEYGGNGIDIGYSITPALGGGYYIGGRRSNADEDFYLLHIDESGLVALDDKGSLHDGNIEVYPNPTSGLFSIKSDVLIVSFELFDATGRLIERLEPVRGSSNKFNINDLNEGLYFLMMTGAKGTKTVRLLKVN